MTAFKRTDVLLPCAEDLSRWSVVACDQFTSEPEYWERVESYVGDAPSALRLILPEAYLNRDDVAQRKSAIAEAMAEYLCKNVFREIKDSFIYVERVQSDGRMRQGLVGAVDLDTYEYAPQSTAPVRATEATVTDRLPPRVAVRREAPLEMPHIMLLMDDPDNSVFATLDTEKDLLHKEYDFPLMEGGGTIRGYSVGGDMAARVELAVSALADMPENSSAGPVMNRPVLAVGDGNHSLAAAKLYWEEVKARLKPEETENHPARYALAELVNVHSPALDFEPIHRILHDTDPSGFFSFFESAAAAASRKGEEKTLLLFADGRQRDIKITGLSAGEVIRLVEESCARYLSMHGGEIDYIHDDDTLRRLASVNGTAAVLLPAIEKSGLFDSVAASGSFPRKSFSMGHARDKRYYLECRRIK